MIFNDMTSQYFDWLRETVCGRWEPRNLSFHKLLAFLFQQDFIPSCEMDASRAEDGRDLRYRFAQEKSIPYAALNSATSGMPCSMLEMMVQIFVRKIAHATTTWTAVSAGRRCPTRKELRMESEAQVLVAALIIAVIYILWKKGEDDGEQ